MIYEASSVPLIVCRGKPKWKKMNESGRCLWKTDMVRESVGFGKFSYLGRGHEK